MRRAIGGHHVVGSPFVWHHFDHSEDTVLAVFINQAVLTFYDINLIFIIRVGRQEFSCLYWQLKTEEQRDEMPWKMSLVRSMVGSVFHGFLEWLQITNWC